MLSLDLSRAGLTIRVETADRADREWLEENLTPSFRVGCSGPAARVVSKTVDPGMHRALLEAGPVSPAARVGCFGFDGHGGTCTRWSAAPTTLYDDELDVFYRLGGEGTRVEVVAPSARPSTRIALLRLVREFASDRIASEGMLLLHAAAMEHDGRGLLIVGPKRAGKTSLLIHCLHDPGSRFIANDRAVVSGDGLRQWRLGGMPTVVSIRPGTVELLQRPAFSAACRWSARMTLGEALVPAGGAPPTPGQPLSISPRQLCHLVEVGCVESSPLRAIVFPRIDTGREGVRIARLSADGARGRLRPHLLRPAGTVFRAASGVTDAATPSEDVLAALEASIPAFECLLGREAFSSRSARSVFSEVFGPAPDS